MASGLFQIVERPDCFIVYRRKIKVGTITRKGIKVLFGDGPNPLEKLATPYKRKPVERKFLGDAIIRGIQFTKAYNKARVRFFRNKKFKPFDKDSKEFDLFVRAAETVKRHKTTNVHFINAQVAGLKFVDGGKGTFPKPHQLVTAEAETRLVEYDRKDVNEKGDEVEVVLNWKEKTEPLTGNSKYQTLRRKIQGAEATMYEAIYVKKCQLARRGEVESLVEDYIDFLKDEAKKSKKKR